MKKHSLIFSRCLRLPFGRLLFLAGMAALAAGIFANSAHANDRDFRSKATGNWNAAATWETNNGAAWVANTVAAGPSSADNVIEITNTITVSVTAAVTADQVVVDSGG